MELTTLIAQPNALPSAPNAVLRLMKTFDNDSAGLGEIVDCIESDPVIVAKLLRLANSPFYYRGRLVENAGDAVRFLGQSKVRALVIGLIAKDSFPAIPPEKLEQFWRFSGITAELSRHIAHTIASDEDAAYTGGLLHMIGELVMRVGMTEQMAKLDETSKPLSIGRGKAETDAFGYSYAEVGTALARQWQLPERIVRIIERQRAPDLNEISEYNAAVVHVASWRASAIELQLPEDLQIRLYPVNAGKALGLDPATIVHWVPQAPAG